MPDLPHVVPIRDDPVLNGVLQCQHAPQRGPEGLTEPQDAQGGPERLTEPQEAQGVRQDSES